MIDNAAKERSQIGGEKRRLEREREREFEMRERLTASESRKKR